RYCRAYQDAWKADRNASHLGVIVDLDFKEGSDDARHSSILSWLEKSLDEPEAVPTIVCSEFGTGKSVTLRQLVANVAEDYVSRSGPRRAVYVDLNSIDIRADREAFVESALYRLPGLSREEVEEIVRLVDQGKVSLVLDGVDEMARPHSAIGRQEAFLLIK